MSRLARRALASPLVAFHRLAVGFFGLQFLRDPLQVILVTRKNLNEVRAWHFALAHTHILDTALAFAHFFDQAAHGVAQGIHLFR